ncbi:MAG: DUF167 domain-containing protein [Deltaproteobacteria bacterium]|nr:DUF167 domain-containing protein [Deltaproteobacteria bacterium]
MKIFITVKPRASKEKIDKISETEYRVSVTAPPEDGKANDAVIRALANFFDVPPSSIKILRGAASCKKQIEIL